jgi:carboxypeptidase Q
MNSKKILTAAVLLVSHITLLAQQTNDSAWVKKISDEILEKGQAYNNLRVLCKTIGQRLSGSAGMYKAEDWAVKVLTAAGADKVYKQQCMVPHWVRGSKEIFRVAKGGGRSLSFNVLSLGNATGTGSKGITAPVIEVKSFDELQALKDEVKNKIVFFNYRYNKKLLGGAYGDAVRYRSSGASAAARYGALGVIVRSVTAANDNHPHTGALRYNDSFPKLPAVAIGPADADRLSDMLQMSYRSTMFYLQTNCQMLPDTIAHNIIGEITGSELPGEIITIGGHLDSWDAAEGAHDDGTGVVQSIEVLRVLKAIGYKPKRTIRIVLFANEENGLRGGNAYMNAAKAANEKHIMAMESDGGGESPKGFSCGMTEAQFAIVSSWKNLFSRYDADKFVFTAGGSGGADIGPLQAAFKTAQFGLNTVGNRYFDYHHAATDVFENVHERELHMGAVTMAAMTYLVDKYGL